MTKSWTETLPQKSGFLILASKYYEHSCTFPNVDEFLAFVLASDYHETKMSPSNKEDFINKFVDKDGTVTVLAPSVYQIIAQKIRD